MGKKTFESIGKPLPNRTNVIVTKDVDFQAPDCFVFASLEEALDFAKKKEKEEIFIIGGGQIYYQTIGLADKLYLTQVKGNFEADTFFPDYSDFKRVISESPLYKSEDYNYKFLELER
jgi:dihydrofolate reductase